MVDRHTSYVYTHNKIPDDFSDPAAAEKLLSVVFQGDSKRVLQSFPDGAKNDLGYALYRLQLGQTPPDRKPVQTVGVGVYALHQNILQLVKRRDYRARDLERILQIQQPRVSELMRGKLSTLSVARLLLYADLLGAQAEVKFKKARAHAAA